MPHGQRDWSNIGADEVVHGLADMGELAARMGSPVTFNREGSILLIETFEHGHGRWELAGIAPYTIEISSEWSRYGAYSLKFDVAAAFGKYALVDTYFPFPVLGKYGVEFSTRFNSHIYMIFVDLRFYDGAHRQNYWLYLYPIDEQLKVYNRSVGAVTVADPFVISTGGAIWHTLKLVVDIKNQYFQRVIIDDAEYDLTAYRPTLVANTGAPHAVLRLQFYGYDTGAGIVYVDDVLITLNEP